MGIKKLYEHFTLKSKIRIYLVIFTMIPIFFVAIWVYWIINKDNMEENFNSLNNNLQKCTSLIDMDFNTYLQKGTYIISNTTKYVK